MLEEGDKMTELLIEREKLEYEREENEGKDEGEAEEDEENGEDEGEDYAEDDDN